MSIFTSCKDAGSAEKKAAAETGLIKPRMAGAQDSSPAKPAENPDKSKLDEKKAPTGRDGSDEKRAAIAKTVAALDQRDVDKSPPPGKKTEASAKLLTQVSDDALPAKRESVHSEASPKPAGAKQASASSDGKTKESEETAFKKHDHSKYIAAVRAKAIDKVNKEKDVTLARVCRNTTTEEWSLTLYRKKQQTYSFVDYAWDEIDEKFEQAFVSDQRPIAGWKQHMDFSASDKECIVLKGGLP